MTGSLHSKKFSLALGGIALVLFAAMAAAAHARSVAQRAAANHPVAAAVSAALGISPRELAADLRKGQTLAQIASANGKTVGGLEQAILAGVTTRLDDAVTAGKLTGQAEQTILTGLGSRLDTLVNAEHPVAHVLGALRRARVVRFVAHYLGVPPQQLVAGLKSGETLAQIAVAQGKTAAALEQAIESAVKARLDQAVSAGKLGSQREQTVLSNLGTRLDALVNHTFGS